MQQQIEALERAAHTLSLWYPLDAATLRQLAADLAAGKLVRREDVEAIVRDFAAKAECRGCPNMEPNLSLNLAADAIAAWNRRHD